jgi:hypothetical protein
MRSAFLWVKSGSGAYPSSAGSYRIGSDGNFEVAVAAGKLARKDAAVPGNGASAVTVEISLWRPSNKRKQLQNQE